MHKEDDMDVEVFVDFSKPMVETMRLTTLSQKKPIRRVMIC